MESGDEAGLHWICWREAGGRQLGRLYRIGLPVIVRDDQGATAVAEFEGGIGQGANNPGTGERRSNSAGHRILRCGSAATGTEAIRTLLPVSTRIRVEMLRAWAVEGIGVVLGVGVMIGVGEGVAVNVGVTVAVGVGVAVPVGPGVTVGVWLTVAVGVGVIGGRVGEGVGVIETW